MLINFIKFIHLIATLGILGSTVGCLFLWRSHSQISLLRLNKFILILVMIAVLTGTLLVYPKHFTFHTPWIQAAYLLVTVFALGILGLIAVIKKKLWKGWVFCYLGLLGVLIGVVHDAVSKASFLWG